MTDTSKIVKNVTGTALIIGRISAQSHMCPSGADLESTRSPLGAHLESTRRQPGTHPEPTWKITSPFRQSLQTFTVIVSNNYPRINGKMGFTIEEKAFLLLLKGCE
jgi:hypothetical protein